MAMSKKKQPLPDDQHVAAKAYVAFDQFLTLQDKLPLPIEEWPTDLLIGCIMYEAEDADLVDSLTYDDDDEPWEPYYDAVPARLEAAVRELKRRLTTTRPFASVTIHE